MKPILFNTDMVRAILDNRKMVTRRVVKPRYCDSVFEMFKDGLCEASIDIPPRDNGDGTTTHFVRVYVPCKAPYRPGDILYVRETWATWSRTYGTIPRILYKADRYTDADKIKWRPSIHMPREAARIFLRVTNVRVERLNDISERSAQSEGVSLPLAAQKDPEYAEYIGGYYNAFAELWNSTIKKDDRALYGWDANPWVWVIEFERVSGEDVKKWHSAKL